MAMVVRMGYFSFRKTTNEWRNEMNKRLIVLCMAVSALSVPVLLSGCSQEVSKTKSSSVSSDGTVKTDEKTVTKSADGTVTKTEESKTTTPSK